jgi:hypothetical protein
MEFSCHLGNGYVALFFFFFFNFLDFVFFWFDLGSVCVLAIIFLLCFLALCFSL